MSNALEKIEQELEDALEALSDAEEDVLRGAWRRERRPGVDYVDAGVLQDGSLELVGTKGEALDKVSAAIRKPGTTVKRTQLPKPTVREFTAAYEKALMRGDRPLQRLLAGADLKYKQLKGRR
jgi:hypothetical protein